MRSTGLRLLGLAAVLTGCGARKDVGGPADTASETGAPCAPVAESCDGLDNDCDGVVDNGLETLTWYPDADGDGYGDDAAAFEACAAPSGAIAVGGDCDDGDATVRPGVPELCDDVDNDCDGRIDDADSNVDGQYTVYVDEDGDGVGVEPAFLFCAVPEGYAAEGGDCDDADALVVAYTWYRDADGDGYGQDGEIEACAPPEGYVDNDLDCDDAEALANPGLEEVCLDGLDNDCDGGANGCRPYEGTYLSSSAGGSIDSADSYVGVFNAAGDTDGDGVREVILASPYAGSHGTGAFYLHEGPSAGATLTDADAGSVVYDDTDAYLGWSGRAAGDVDADGYDDLIAYDQSDMVWIGDGPFASSETFTSAALATLTGADADASTRGSLDGADLDGDGWSDLILGAAYATSSYTYEGVGCVVSGAAVRSGAAVTDLATVCVWGGVTEACTGRAVAALGDVNGDGLREVGVAAPLYSTAWTTMGGALAVFDITLVGTADLGDADLLIVGGDEYFLMGLDVAGEGDADGDGYADVLVSSAGDPYYGGSHGAAQLYYGASALSSPLTALDADVVVGSTHRYELAQHLTWAGDMDADGADEIVAADDSDETYASSGGAAYLFYGPPSALVLSQADADASFSGASGASFGVGAEGGGDLDGDGFDDLIVGESGGSTVRLFFGWPL